MTDDTDPRARETFLAVLARPPLQGADAIVVLCGEDGVPRAKVGLHLLAAGYAPRVVLSGGLDDPPRLMGATTLHARLMGKGLAPDRILLEGASTNTREQAVNVVALAQSEGWKALLLVASPQHLPRAFLTFLRALQEVGATGTVRLVPVPASQLAWWSAPEGVTTPRIELLGAELAKCEQYREHVARYEEGLAYLQHWEGVA